MRIFLAFIVLLFSGGLLANTLPVEPDLKLNQEERQWLMAHPVIKFTGDPNWLPFEAFDTDEKYIGIVSEHLALIEKSLGITFEKIPTATWTESVNMAKSGEVDVLSETDDSALKSHLFFTQSYLKNPVVIVMRNDENYVENIDKIKNKKIGVIKDYGYVSKIVKKYDYIDFTVVDDIQDGLIAVSTGRTDALLCTVTLCGYTIAELGLHGVKVTGKTEFDTQLAFGVNKSSAALVPILNKAINNISDTQQQHILDHWMMYNYVEKVDYSLLWKSLIISLLIFSVVVIFWNRRLTQEISLRKSIEGELTQAKKIAEEADKAKSEFLANMSHEIRTPMNGVLGMAELLEHGSLDEVQKKYVQTILRSGNTLMVVINDILDYSSIQAGKLELHMHYFNLQDLLEETVVPFRLNPESNVKFEVNIDPGVPVHLKGDSVRLHQIINNLLNNAFKFTDDGYIKINIKVVEQSDHNAVIDFNVSDTGVGIDEGVLKNLFQPFTQADQTTARRHGGTGLGLAICKRLIEFMDSEIKVESEPGKGTSFSFTINFKTEIAPEYKEEGLNEKTNSFSGIKILLAEDNIVNQMVVKGYIDKLGAQLSIVSDGLEAVDLLCESARHFDLILMDCEMPNLDGYAATQRIRQWELKNKYPETRICALTAHVLPAYVDKCIAAGMNYHLAKPVKLKELKKVLQEILEKETV